MGRAKVILASVALLTCGPTALWAQDVSESDSRVSWLEAHAIRVRTVEPADDEFSDLAPLKDVLAGVRLVLLGEAFHGDGATFLGKSRLIKFLHEEMGFDVLVFESGFYDCAKAWDLFDAAADIHATFRQCVWGMWAEFEEVQALIDYMGETQQSEDPMVLAGLDVGFTGVLSGDSLIHELRDLIGSIRTPGVEDERINRFLGVVEHLQDYRGRKLEKPGPVEIEDVASTARELVQAIETSEELVDRERSFWALVLENLAVDVPWRLAPAFPPALELVELRDSLMARNLTWLMNDRYPGRKFVVWSATLHNARNLRALEVAEDTDTPWGISLQELYRQKRVMGDYLWGDLGDEMYSLGFTAFEGENYVGRGESRKLEHPSPGSIEDLFARADLDAAIVDFRRSPAGGEWLREELKSRPLGYLEMTAAWNDVLDGMVFIRVMTPKTRINN